MSREMWHEFQPLTSEIDWCESNYAMLSNVAEFWNTVSNFLFFIIPPLLLYLFRQYAKQIGYGVNLIWVLLMVVGLGSAIFHSTLSFVGQMLDELAILWVCSAAIATWLPTTYIPYCMVRWKFQCLILSLTLAASVAAFVEPRVNQFFLFLFGVPGIWFMVKELQRCKCPKVYQVGLTATAWWVMGVCCWCSDRHVLVCLGSYMACVCYAYFYAMHEVPEKCPTLRFWPHDSHTWFGIPYVALKIVNTEPTKML